jgi:heat shock protein HslJ
LRRARAAAALPALVLAACAATPAPHPLAAPQPAAAAAPALAGTRWVGVVAGDPDPRTLPRLEFVAAGRVTGYTGCNLLNGAWRVEGAAARLGPLATTKRMCIGPEAEVERRLIAALGGTAVREGERLVFTGPGGERFEFTPAQAS